MRNRIALGLLAMISATLFVAAQNGNHQDKSDIEKKILELKKAHFEILKQRVAALESQLSQGEIKVMKVIRAKEDVYQATGNGDTAQRAR